MLASWLWARVGVQRELAMQQSDRLAYENRRLTQRMFALQEEERRLLAQELHDEMGQSLMAIKTNAVLILRHNQEADGGKTAESAEDIRAISTHLFQVVRQRLRQLRPPLLDHAGLNVCLKDAVSSWEQRTGIRCRLRIDGEIDHLDGATSIGVFRIIQEALTNISRHAQASSVSIHLRRRLSRPPQEKDMLDLEIKDNGIGIDADKQTAGLGLVGMRERAGALGGSFSISSEQGNGVSIIVHIPLQFGQDEGD